MTNPGDYLAKALKKFRNSRSWSLDRTAEKTGVSKAMLGQIERGESSPTVATLWKIATGLEVSLSSFIAPLPDEPNGMIIRKADDIRQHPAGGGLKIAPLFPFDERFGFEYLELTFKGGYERISEPHEPGVTEFISIISGELEIWFEKRWHSLGKGRSIRFAGDMEHGYRNSKTEDAVVMIVIHYPNRLNSQLSNP